MAAEKIALKLEFEDGQKENGKPRLRTKTFSNVHPGVQDHGLLAGGQAIASLYEKPCKGILKVETVRLSQEG